MQSKSNIIKLDQVKGIGPKTLKGFRDQNIWSTYDLVLSLPKRYEHRYIEKLDHLMHQDVITIQAQIDGDFKVSHNKKIPVTFFKITHESKTYMCIAFRRPYLVNQFKSGDHVVITGKYHHYEKKIVINYITLYDKHINVKPNYGYDFILDANLTKIMHTVFEESLVSLFETLPPKIVIKNNLLSRSDAYRLAHLPSNHLDLSQAVLRFKYEEAYQFIKRIQKTFDQKMSRLPITYQIKEIKEIINALSFELTTDQKKAVNDIYKDFKKDYAVSRLIQGDVGSGKTIVAFLAILGVVSTGKQALFMAPTEMLAKQQYEAFNRMFKNTKTALFTSKSKDKKAITEKVKANEVSVIFGTHALANDTLIFSDLVLVIIDEQHKFGVEKRGAVIQKGVHPHVIYLTATPIPRTLAITYFGNIEISVIKEKPKDRLDVISYYYDERQIEKCFLDVNKHLDLGEKVFVVVPAIDSELVDYDIVKAEALIRSYTQYNVLVMHGKMNNEEQQIAMETFKAGGPQILLATSIIEVGIDIPNATVMIVLNADRFGISQLHQLRGRVGRSKLQSYCYFVSKKTDIERLEILSQTTDGFELSAFDLKTRGPGLFFDSSQSGFDQFKFLDFNQDAKIILQAKKDLTFKD